MYKWEKCIDCTSQYQCDKVKRLLEMKAICDESHCNDCECSVECDEICEHKSPSGVLEMIGYCEQEV